MDGSLTRRMMFAALGIALPLAAEAAGHRPLLGRASGSLPPDFTVSDAAGLQNAVNLATIAGGNRRIAMLNGGVSAYGSTIIDLTGFNPAAPITVYSLIALGAVLPGVDLGNSSNFVFNDTTFTRASTGVEAGVCSGIGASNLAFYRCEFSGDVLLSADYRGSATVSGVSGAFIDGEVITTSVAGGIATYRASGSTPTKLVLTGCTQLSLAQPAITAPLSVTLGSAVVTVTEINHAHPNGCSVTFRNAAAVGGITPNGTFPITRIDSNTYSYVFTSPATSTAVGGGAALTVSADDMSGNFYGCTDTATGWFVNGSSTWRAGIVVTGQTSGATATLVSGSSSPRFNIGFYANLGGCHGLIIDHCNFHDLKWPMAGNGTAWTITNNTFDDLYVSFGDLDLDISGWIYSGNDGINIWARDTDGQGAGSNGPHSSLLGISTTSNSTTLTIISLNTLGVGVKRALTVGGRGSASGPKINDVPVKMTASITAGVMTVSSAVAAGTIKAGQRVWNSGTPLPDGLLIDHQVSGTTGGGSGAVYALNNASVTRGSSTTTYVSATNSGWTITNNFFISDNSLGFQLSSVGTCEFGYNTIISDLTSNPIDDAASHSPTTQTSLYISDLAPGNVIHHNIIGGFAIGTPGPNIDLSNYTAAGRNVTCTEGWTTGAASRGALFVGNASPSGFDIDQNTTPADLRAMFASKPSGAAAGLGASGTYAPYTAARTTVANGTAFGAVTFDGVNDFTRYTKGGAKFLDITDPTKFTLVIDAAMLNDSDAYPVQGSSSNVWVRRLPSGLVRFIFKDASLNTNVQIDSSLTWKAADGAAAWTITLDFANYAWHLCRGSVRDAFALVSTFTGNAMIDTTSTLTVGASSLGGTKANMAASTFYATDEFLDLESTAVWNRLVGLDNNLVSFGVDGHLLTGTQPRAFLQSAVPATWNAGGGYNLGSAAQKFIMTGAVS